MFLDTIRTHAPDFDCDDDGRGDVHTAADQNITTRLDTVLQPDFESSQYQLPFLLSNRSSPGCIPPFHLSIHQHAVGNGKRQRARSMTSLSNQDYTGKQMKTG